MQIINDSFGNVLTISTCKNTEYYTNDDIQTAINAIFNLPEIKNRIKGQHWDAQYGEGETSEIVPYLKVENLSGTKDLIEWIKTECLLALPNFYECKSNNIVIDRSWMNKLDYGTQGRCHRHLGIDYGDTDDTNGLGITPDLVGIFYVNAPDDSSDLIIIKDGEHRKLHDEFPEEQKYYLRPKTGELVLHQPDIWHAIGKHNNKDPRICFVFHISYTYNI